MNPCPEFFTEPSGITSKKGRRIMIYSSAQYHSQTSYRRHQMTGHYLDWQNQPMVYKTYPGIEPILLPREVGLPEMKLSALLKKDSTEYIPPSLSLEELSRIFLLTYNLTAKARHAGGDFYYRSVPSAGALYPSELYVASNGVRDLQDGLYHFSIAHHGLSLLRLGRFASHMAQITSTLDGKAPLLTFFFSAIFFRSAWKYRDRSYRYHLLDTGHLIEHLILALKALDLHFYLTYDFDDKEANRFLGLDEKKEVALAVCHVSGLNPRRQEIKQELPELQAEFRDASVVASYETYYPAIREVHDAGNLAFPFSRQNNAITMELGLPEDQAIKTESSETWPEIMDFPDGVRSRRSRRNYVVEAMPRGSLLSLLESINTTKAESSDPVRTIRTGFLVGQAQELEPGFYLLEEQSGIPCKITTGFLVDKMAHICLDQEWLTHAAVHFLFMTDLDNLERHLGPRGYRYAMMTAGRLGERLYLTATVLGLGCCGIGAFYDIEAAELLKLNRTSRVLYVVAVGPVKSIKVGSPQGSPDR
jgi:SagB-type dehydrogenase family enzyme